MALDGFEARDCCAAVGRSLRKNLLLVLIIIGCLLGFIIGVAVNESVQQIQDPEKKATTIMLIGFPGEILLNMLKMMVLPLIVASLVCAMASLESTAAGRIGRRTVIYYLSTTVLAAIVGIVLAAAIRPGEIEGSKSGGSSRGAVRTLDGFLDLLRSFFPKNIVEAAVFGRKTTYKTAPATYEMRNMTNTTMNATYLMKVQLYAGSKFVPAGTTISSGMNVLGIVVFSILFGGILGRMGERGAPMKGFFDNLNEIVMVMVMLAMWYSPIGICSLIAQKVASMPDAATLLALLGKFIATVLAGLVIHGLILQPLLYFIITRKNPYKFLFGIRDAILTAFGLASSAATMPTTIRCVEQNNNIDPRISRFVIPLGTTVNMDGTAFYEGVAALFIAQMNGIELSVPQMITTVFTATGASVGAAAIPSAGLVTMVMVLQAVGLPTDDIALIFAVDWFLDRCRTTTNVMGDALGSGVVQHLSQDELKPRDTKENKGLIPLDNYSTTIPDETFHEVSQDTKI